MAVINFDATQIDPRQSEGGVCFPLADYPMEIVKVEQVATKDNPNKGFLAISLKVLDGQYANQVQVDRLNMYGQSEVTTRIAYQRLSGYCHIAGKLRIADSNELLGTKLIATCGPQDAPNDKYSDVKMVKDIAGNPPVFGVASAPQPVAGVHPVAVAAAIQQTATPGWNNPAQAAQPVAAAASTPWASNGGTTPVAAGNTPPWAK